MLDAALLAHQGGWDEILLVAGPIAVIAGLLALAKKRVDRANGDVDDADVPAGQDPSGGEHPSGTEEGAT